MRSGRRGPISPAMGVAFAALVVAVGGTTFAAASGDFSSGDTGLVQACVAQADIVNSIVDPVAGALNSATSGALTSVTTAVTPKGTLIVVAPGATCPPNTTPQSLSSIAPQAPQYGEARSAHAMKMGSSKTEVTSLTLPAGTHLVNATADIVQRADSSVDSTIKCALVDAAGNTIPGTTSAVTIPAGSKGTHVTIPLGKRITLAAPADIGVSCKDPAAAASGTRNAKTRAHAAVFSNSDATGQINDW